MNQRHTLLSAPKAKTVEFDVPFYTQQATLTDGFSDISIAQHWEQRGCGIASLRMVVAHATNGTQPQKTYAELIEEGIAIGAYAKGKGWIHAGLAEMARTYQIKAETFRQANTETVAKTLDEGWITIVSVTKAFRGGELNPDTNIRCTPGGHLVLAQGVGRDQNGKLTHLRCHHPSSKTELNWPNVWIGTERFIRSFNGTGIKFKAPC